MYMPVTFDVGLIITNVPYFVEHMKVVLFPIIMPISVYGPHRRQRPRVKAWFRSILRR
ncbi:hypothetical protein RchiOBHm_Chr4g0398331 [Rosa chinensis]|uniref:Uncharacterized protein n=1 Tax=Rosa chinensis TaxID=74649 RepID=A0A2P6QSA4_ROSCH|nr:hypothetical protein RchiOBHm_Chr4g0398331 [Rosa chinensis]